MAESTHPASATRVGDAERADAQRALQIHLAAGRLQVTEFVERFGGAAEAVTAADLAALFADLPSPHPTLPRPPRDARPRAVLVVGAVALLALVGVLGFVLGRDRAAPAPPRTVVAAPASTGSVAESPAAPPDGWAVRRTTGPGLITLRPSYGVDLDDVDDPTWDVGTGCCGHDVLFGTDAGRLFITDGHAALTGPLDYATCLHETAYTDAAMQRATLRPGDTMCVRTNGHRLALVTIVEVSADAVEFGATVWDPPIPS